MNIGDIPGLRQHLNELGHSLIRVIDANQKVSWSYPPQAEDLIHSYSVDQSRDYLKRKVDEIESAKFNEAFIAEYGAIPPVLKTIKWPDKAQEANRWYAWAEGGRVGAEPLTEVIDAETTEQQTREDRVIKVIAKAAKLEALRGAIEHQAVVLDDQLNSATSFAELTAVNLHAGWPV